jgi:hypothetical protein
MHAPQTEHSPRRPRARTPWSTSSDAEVDTWAIMTQILASVEGIREFRIWQVMLSGICASGLAMGLAQASLARSDDYWAAAQLAAVLFFTFYATNAAGILMMDRARGLGRRDVLDALQDALGSAHRLILAVLIVLAAMAVVCSGLLGLLWLCRPGGAGALLYALISPLIVVSIGMLGLVLFAVVIPLTAPAVWSGARTLECVRILWWMVRNRLLMCVLLSGVLAAFTALVGTIASAVVLGSGWVMAQASLVVLHLDIPAPMLMIGLLGRSVASLGQVQVPTSDAPYLYASIVGGGVVFALALVPPALVYMRGVCAIFLGLTRSRGDRGGQIG